MPDAKHQPMVTVSIPFDRFVNQFSWLFCRIVLLDDKLQVVADFFDNSQSDNEPTRLLGCPNFLKELIASGQSLLVSAIDKPDETRIISVPVLVGKFGITVHVTLFPISGQNKKAEHLFLMISEKPVLSYHYSSFQIQENFIGECIVDRNFNILWFSQSDLLENKGRWFPDLFDPDFRDYILQTLLNFVKTEMPDQFRAISADNKQWLVVKLSKIEHTDQIRIKLTGGELVAQTNNTKSVYPDLSRCLLEMGNIFSQNSDIQKAIEQSLEFLRQELRLHSLAIMQDHPTGEQFIALHTALVVKDSKHPILGKIPYDFTLGFKKVLEKNLPIVSDSIFAGLPENLLGYVLQLGVKSYAAVPIFIAGKFYGALVAAQLKEKQWENSEVKFLQAAAAMIGQNIDREMNRLQLLQSRDDFINIFNSAADMVFIITFSGEIIEANQSAVNISGYSLDSLIGTSINELTISPDEMEADLTGEAHQSQQLITGTTLITKDGRKVPIEVREKIITYQGKRAILIVARDISERKNIDRLILKTILDTEDKERKKFAETIHDDLAPLLSALKIYINLFATKKIEPGTEDEMLDQMQQIIDQSIATARQTAVAMMPHLLSHFGFIEAVEDFIQKINKTKVIKIELSVYPQKFTLPSATSRILYSIVKELINNTLKHSQATLAHLELLKQKEFLKISYRENGKGFDFQSKLREDNSSLGLKNLVSKVESLSGNILFNRTEQGESVFKISVPLIEEG